MYEATLLAAEPSLMLSVFGVCDQHVKAIRAALDVQITHRDGEIFVSGGEDAVARATEVLEHVKALAERKGTLAVEDVSALLSRVTGESSPVPADSIEVIEASRKIRPRSAGQARYVETMRKRDIVLSVGPAGSGKTYLAVALAVEALKQGNVRKIVLVRPAVEAGESLGFLPGDLQAKINPYLRPLLDALHEMIDYDQIKEFMEQDVIEVVPLGYMRGRTLNEAFVILDEGQNTTVAQMKMFLTRMGERSRLVIAGDITQVDLPPHTRSGLTDALTRLANIEGIGVVHLTKADIVRHRLVQEIVRAYDNSSSGGGRKRTR
ncbi:MAG: PhoH family protein [Pirellulaceae bacterium]